jgi:hypothetical protein
MAADPAESIVRIATPAGETLGTGFFCTLSGDVLTCGHVVRSHEAVTVCASDSRHETVSRDRFAIFDDVDVALIRTTLKPPLVPPLTRLRPPPESRVWTMGFQYEGIGVTRAYPVRGLISGTTHVQYEYGSSSNDVFVFSDAPVDHGLSGAPLIDERAGTVLGVVLAKLPDHVRQLGGLALPLSHLDRFPDGRALLQENSDSVPAFGDFINTKGLTVLASTVSEQTVAALSSSGHFLPAFAVARQALAADFATFVTSGDVLFPIIADSGKGKTFGLTTLVNGAPQRQPTVFLRSIDVLPTDSSLGVAVSRMLSEAAARIGSTSPQGPRVIEAVARNGEGLLIVQDAINEMVPALRSDIEGWLTRSVDWLRASGARWVVSSRPEFWQPLMPILRGAQVKVFVDGQRKDGLEGHWLGDFDDSETLEAMKRYSMDEGLIAANEARHPLLARAYWEASKDRTSPGHALASRYAVFSAFVDAKVMAVARRTTSSSQLVRHLLSKAATEVCKSGRYDLSLAAFHAADLFGPVPAIAQQLVAEHIFLETGDAYRFSFETVAELLASEPVWAMTSSYSSQDWAQVPDAARISMLNAVSFAALRSEHQGSVEQTRSCLESLVAAYQAGSSGEVDRRAFAALSRAVSWLTRPAEFAYMLEELAVEMPAGIIYYVLDEARLPPPMAWRLLRLAAVHEDPYDWEPKHWHYALSERYGIGKIAAQLFRRDARQTVAALLEWIGETESQGRGLTLSDVAGGLLYRYRAADVDFVYGALADRRYEDFFYRLSDHEPAELATIVLLWLQVPRRQHMALRCVGWLLNVPERAEALMAGVHDIYLRTENDEDRDSALELLTRPEGGRGAFFDDVLRRADAVGLPPMAHLLYRYLNTRFDEVYGWLESRGRRDPALRAQTVSALADVDGTDSHRSAVVEIVAQLWRRHRHLTAKVSFFIESRFYREPPNSEAAGKLAKLATELVRAGALEQARTLIFAATAQGPEGIAACQLELVDEIIAVHRNQSDLGLLAQQLVLNGDDRPDVWQRVDKIPTVLSSEGLLDLLGDATINEELTAVLARWVTNGLIESGSGWAQVLKDGLEKGLTADDAVRAAFDGTE